MIKPEKGDRVSVMVPFRWTMYGTVVETDYHPFGIDDAVKIQFEDMPVKEEAKWWDLRYIQKESAR